MKKAPYLSKTDLGKGQFLTNFALKIPTYATATGISAAEVTACDNYAKLFNWALSGKEAYKTASQEWTAYKDQLRDGPALPLPVLEAPVLPAMPTVPASGGDIFLWIGNIVKRIKAS